MKLIYVAKREFSMWEQSWVMFGFIRWLADFWWFIKKIQTEIQVYWNKQRRRKTTDEGDKVFNKSELLQMNFGIKILTDKSFE